jgi:hypothetical protein
MILVSEVEYKKVLKTLEPTVISTTTQEIVNSKLTVTEKTHFCVGVCVTKKMEIKDESKTTTLFYIIA